MLVRLKQRQTGFVINVDKADWEDPSKYGPTDKVDWIEIPSEEDEHKEVHDRVLTASKRYDEAVSKRLKKRGAPAPVSAPVIGPKEVKTGE